MTTFEAVRELGDRVLRANVGEPNEGVWDPPPRLGHDVRLVLVAVGGGAVRVAREIAQRHVRHLETVAINCDPKVQGFEDFDRRVYLGPESGSETDTGGSPVVGGLLARAAEPSLQRIFEGATFVILLGSLGGGAGSGAFPYVLEVAARNAEVVSAFVIKPFRCEGERRARADRAIGRLHLVEAFTEKREGGRATLQVLDNESLVPLLGRSAFVRVGQHWAKVLENHIEQSFLVPTESLLDAAQLAHLSQIPGLEPSPAAELTPLEEGVSPAPPPAPAFPSPMPAASRLTEEAELTFEVVENPRPATLP